jgi:RNA polymerase sigma-70 factor (ECF subfamily)
VEQSGATELVQEQLAQLRVEDQELLRLAAWEELPHDQIATVLGISVNAVGIRLHRARNRLGRRLERAGYAGVVTDENRRKDSDVGRTQTEVRDESTSDNADKEPM